MNCPRCEGATMHERDREGITIDVCEKCRGIFLDRGELEKLISYATRDDDDERYARERAATPDGGVPRDRAPQERRDWEKEPPSSDFGRKRHPHHRKEGFLSRLGDFFD